MWVRGFAKTSVESQLTSTESGHQFCLDLQSLTLSLFLSSLCYALCCSHEKLIGSTSSQPNGKYIFIIIMDRCECQHVCRILYFIHYSWENDSIQNGTQWDWERERERVENSGSRCHFNTFVRIFFPTTLVLSISFLFFTYCFNKSFIGAHTHTQPYYIRLYMYENGITYIRFSEWNSISLWLRLCDHLANGIFFPFFCAAFAVPNRTHIEMARRTTCMYIEKKLLKITQIPLPHTFMCKSHISNVFFSLFAVAKK